MQSYSAARDVPVNHSSNKCANVMLVEVEMGLFHAGVVAAVKVVEDGMGHLAVRDDVVAEFDTAGYH